MKSNNSVDNNYGDKVLSKLMFVHPPGMHVYEGFTVIKNKGGEPAVKGDTPVVEYDKDKDEWSVYYCYYIPALKGR